MSGSIAWLADAGVLLASQDGDDDHHTDAVALLRAGAVMATLDLAWYEACNVSVRRWRDLERAATVRAMVASLAGGGGLVRVDERLLERASVIADREGISVYDAAYVAGAERIGARLVSCDLRDLVSRGLAVTPREALAGPTP